MDLLTDLRLSAIARLGTMANLRWFTPNDTFWELLEPFKDKKIVDCGCGVGDTTREGIARGFDMVGIDLVKRAGQHALVLPVDACAYPFSKNVWPLVCRPDHSGWAHDCLSNAMTRGATAMYVGKMENLDRDLDDLQEDVIHSYRDVGNEGEVLCIMRREHD